MKTKETTGQWITARVMELLIIGMVAGAGFLVYAGISTAMK